MGGVAGRGLLRLGEQRLAMADQEAAQPQTLRGDGLEIGKLDRGGGAGKQHDGIGKRHAVAERLEASDDAVAAGHRDLDVLAFGKIHDDGDSAAVREHDLGRGHARLDEDGFADHLQRFQPCSESFELLGRQGLQQLI